MSYLIRKYLETQEAFKGTFVFGRPRWQFVTLNQSFDIPENKNENRVFIWLHLIQMNDRAAQNNCTWTFSPSGDVMQAFQVAAGGTSWDGIYRFDMIVPGNHLTVTCTQASTCNYGFMWQPITVDKKR